MRACPTPEEEFAFEVVRRGLGNVTIDDSIERRGPAQVDGHILQADGRSAALEVTQLVDPDKREIENRLGAEDRMRTIDGLQWR